LGPFNQRLLGYESGARDKEHSLILTSLANLGFFPLKAALFLP
jgi:hypothetical protein